ncbi:EXPB15, partial [Linum grandiflorum]
GSSIIVELSMEFPIDVLLCLFIAQYILSLSGQFCVNASIVQNFQSTNSTSSFNLNSILWAPAGATWYGAPNGDGSEGGACGYGKAVGLAPFNSMISAGGPSLFQSGGGCGACYQVKCTSNPACSGVPVIVAITDECPGGPCLSESVHFDLSGTAFGAMAKRGSESQLRNAGIVQIQHRRVPCFYRRKTITFVVDAGSNPYYLASVIEFENGDGELGRVEVKQASSNWIPMQRLWGALWKLNSGSPLGGPLSFRLTSKTSKKTIVAQNVLPYGWQPGQTYRSAVNF